jgi:hypothetical protein
VRPAQDQETQSLSLSARHLKNVLRKMRYIHARKLVPNWKTEPFQSLGVGLLNVFRFSAILRQPVREVVQVIEARRGHRFGLTGLSVPA